MVQMRKQYNDGKKGREELQEFGGKMLGQTQEMGRGSGTWVLWAV